MWVLYVSAGDDIDEAGEWWSLIDIVAEDGAVTRAAVAWQINMTRRRCSNCARQTSFIWPCCC